jgi:hypothetical protein
MGVRTALRMAVLGPFFLAVMGVAWLLNDAESVEGLRRIMREGVRPIGDERSPG